MSHFVESVCKFDTECLVSQASWSHSDPVAALSTTTVDKATNRKIYKMQFINSEVSNLLVFKLPLKF